MQPVNVLNQVKLKWFLIIAKFSKKKIEYLFKTLSKFTMGRSNLEIVLGSQNDVFDKVGLGYKSIKKLTSFFVLENQNMFHSIILKSSLSYIFFIASKMVIHQEHGSLNISLF